MRFLCLARARMAKREVLERILERKVSDGAWDALPAEKKRGVALFQQLREQYANGMPVESILESHPDIDVHYHQGLKKHVVVFSVGV